MLSLLQEQGVYDYFCVMRTIFGREWDGDDGRHGEGWRDSLLKLRAFPAFAAASFSTSATVTSTSTVLSEFWYI